MRRPRAWLVCLYEALDRALPLFPDFVLVWLIEREVRRAAALLAHPSPNAALKKPRRRGDTREWVKHESGVWIEGRYVDTVEEICR